MSPFAWATERAPIVWPDGARMAVCLTWDVDAEIPQYVRNPERVTKVVGQLHQGMYGPLVALPKVFDLLEHHQRPATFFVPSKVHERYPFVIPRAIERGHAIGLHGVVHEPLEELDETRERALLAEQIDVVSAATGGTPKSYRSPSWELGRRTPALLSEFGILAESSLMDAEHPYLLEFDGGELLQIPIHWLLDDAEYWLHTRDHRMKAIDTPDDVLRTWLLEFEGYRRVGGCYVLTLHPYISGRWAHMWAVHELLETLARYDDIWWCTFDELIDHCSTASVRPTLERRRSPGATVTET